MGEKKKCCRIRMKPILALCIISTVLGSSTQFGYNIGVINNPETVIVPIFQHLVHLFHPLSSNSIIFSAVIAISILCSGYSCIVQK